MTFDPFHVVVLRYLHPLSNNLLCTTDGKDPPFICWLLSPVRLVQHSLAIAEVEHSLLDAVLSSSYRFTELQGCLIDSSMVLKLVSHLFVSIREILNLLRDR